MLANHTMRIHLLANTREVSPVNSELSIGSCHLRATVVMLA